jgi:hypothetical protein
MYKCIKRSIILLNMPQTQRMFITSILTAKIEPQLKVVGLLLSNFVRWMCKRPMYLTIEKFTFQKSTIKPESEEYHFLRTTFERH